MIIFGQNLEISTIVMLAWVTQKKSRADWATSLNRDINPIQLPNSLFCVPFQHNIAKMTVFFESYSFLAEYKSSKMSKSYLSNSFGFFDTPGSPGGASIMV